MEKFDYEVREKLKVLNANTDLHLNKFEQRLIERNAQIAKRNEIATERDATERRVGPTELPVELLRKRLDSSVRRAQVAKIAAMVRAIGAGARALPRRPAKRPNMDRIALKDVAATDTGTIARSAGKISIIAM
ncbi:hypothetical protein [Sphingobium algorifonticola]|uniref:Uncharacterized protein n=1 Tax=Sphingobium algorifonticola TaxID=2008318 RepID=A0A437J4U1_9SPHN|nr:hypothetical protein [Sphingobium algorifonticola]RVT39781.1 hypothetical protein ENE74_13600 [Sphingobium algorifonticola]